jgi:Mg-chelatase subunit ChlD
MSAHVPQRRSGGGLLVLLIIGIVVLARIVDKNPPGSGPSTTASTPVSTPVTNPVADLLRRAAGIQQRDGVAAAILIDTSGSMADNVRDTDGKQRPKIQIAQRAALDLVNQFDTYARDHKDQTVYVGIYEFSDRGKKYCREVVKLGPAGERDANVLRSAVSAMRPDGGTPIGDAMITAKLDIDATGLSKRHILVLTDGENNKGYSPDDVTRTIVGQSEEQRASIYFVAFDIAESRSNRSRMRADLSSPLLMRQN